VGPSNPPPVQDPSSPFCVDHYIFVDLINVEPISNVLGEGIAFISGVLPTPNQSNITL
jgi:hypothetical protein